MLLTNQATSEKLEVPMTHSLHFIICKNGSQNSGKQFTFMIASLLQRLLQRVQMNSQRKRLYRARHKDAARSFQARDPPSSFTCSEPPHVCSTFFLVSLPHSCFPVTRQLLSHSEALAHQFCLRQFSRKPRERY